MGVSMTICRLWHLAQTALSDWPSRARSGAGGARRAAPRAQDCHKASAHAARNVFNASAMHCDSTHVRLCTDGVHARQGDGCAARHRRDMRTNAQFLRGLVIAETIGELVGDALGVAIVERDVQQLFAVHGASIFVLHLADDLVRLHVDDVARRGIGIFAVQTEGHPEGARRGVDGVDFLRIIGIGENVDLLEDAVGQPDFLFVRGQRDAVAGAAVGQCADAGSRSISISSPRWSPRPS